MPHEWPTSSIWEEGNQSDSDEDALCSSIDATSIDDGFCLSPDLGSTCMFATPQKKGGRPPPLLMEEEEDLAYHITPGAVGVAPLDMDIHWPPLENAVIQEDEVAQQRAWNSSSESESESEEDSSDEEKGVPVRINATRKVAGRAATQTPHKSEMPTHFQWQSIDDDEELVVHRSCSDDSVYTNSDDPPAAGESMGENESNKRRRFCGSRKDEWRDAEPRFGSLLSKVEARRSMSQGSRVPLRKPLERRVMRRVPRSLQCNEGFTLCSPKAS